MKNRKSIFFVLLAMCLMLAVFVGCDPDLPDVPGDTGNPSPDNPQVGTETVKYTVTFVNADGSVLDIQEVEQGQSATAPSQPTLAGTVDKTYTFKEWDTDFSNVQSNLTVTAVYTENVRKYTVTFKDGEGNTLASDEVEYQGTVEEPVLELGEDKGFIGWYKDKEFLTVFDFETETVTANMEVYAELADVSMLTFTLKDDLTYEVSDADSLYAGAIVIPYKYKNAVVTGIGENAFASCSDLTDIKIPQNIKSIGNGAFASCSGLTEIVLPDELESLGNGVFKGCGAIKTMKIPQTVTALGDELFYSCYSLETIQLHDGVKSIGDRAFRGCGKLQNFALPQSLNHIGEEAFRQCYGITRISIPQSVTSISKMLFSECINLSEVHLPDTLESIGQSAFYKCTSLTQISLPSSLQELGNYAFSACSGLTGSVTLPSGLKRLGISAFQSCSGITSINIPSSLTFIGQYVVENCSSLQSINVMMSQSKMEQLANGTNWDKGIPSTCSINYYG